MTQKYKFYRYLVTLGFNLVLFYLIYFWVQKNIQWQPLLEAIQRITVSSILCIVGLYSLIVVLYSARFALLLKTDYKKAFCVISVGNGINNLLPFRLGDILRLYFAKQFYSINTSHTLAATFVERYFDLVMLLVFGGIILFDKHLGLEHAAVYLFLTLLGCSVVSLVLYRCLIVKKGYLSNQLERIRYLRSLLQSLGSIMSGNNKSFLILLTVLVWWLVLLVYYFFFKMNLNHEAFDWGSAVFLLFTTTLSFAIPYAVAGVGVFEAAIVYYLTRYLSVAPTEALALAIIFHVGTALPQIIAMMWVLMYKRTHWGIEKKMETDVV